MEYITPYRLTQLDKLQNLVEHRSKFSLDFCELNVFETRQKAEDFHLKFDGITITSMLRGKKIMHLEGIEDFEYVPGETVIAPADTLMRIDFPEAELQKPTQCTALVLDQSYLRKQLDLINEKSGNNRLHGVQSWNLNFSDAILKNNRNLASVSNQLLRVFTQDEPFKDYQVDLLLRELVLSLLKLQNYNYLKKDSRENSNKSAFHAVLNHIEGRITTEIRIDELCKVAGMSKSSFYRAFTEEYGITPVQLILEERLKFAKRLLNDENLSVKEVAYASGFNDPNYFSRMFRKLEGYSPSEYKNNNGSKNFF